MSKRGLNYIVVVLGAITAAILIACGGSGNNSGPPPSTADEVVAKVQTAKTDSEGLEAVNLMNTYTDIFPLIGGLASEDRVIFGSLVAVDNEDSATITYRQVLESAISEEGLATTPEKVIADLNALRDQVTANPSDSRGRVLNLLFRLVPHSGNQLPAIQLDSPCGPMSILLLTVATDSQLIPRSGLASIRTIAAVKASPPRYRNADPDCIAACDQAYAKSVRDCELTKSEKDTEANVDFLKEEDEIDRYYDNMEASLKRSRDSVSTKLRLYPNDREAPKWRRQLQSINNRLAEIPAERAAKHRANKKKYDDKLKENEKDFEKCKEDAEKAKQDCYDACHEQS